MTIIIKIEHLHHHILFPAIYLILAFWCWSLEEISFCGNKFVTDAAGEKLCQCKVSFCTILKSEGWLGKKTTSTVLKCVFYLWLHQLPSGQSVLSHCIASNSGETCSLHSAGSQQLRKNSNSEISNSSRIWTFQTVWNPSQGKDSVLASHIMQERNPAFNKFFALILTLKAQIISVTHIPDGFSKLN